MAINLSPEEITSVFGDHDPTQHQAEAAERWGSTDAYKQSEQRTSQYSKDDWQQAQKEAEAVVNQFIVAMNAGLPASSPEAKAAAEAHRLNISTWYYDCSHEMQTNLAEMYLADPRFTAYYDSRHEGLAQYVHDAIFANALDIRN
ncbi:MAG: HTH-type transcriptional activator TipA [Actinomycetota bacterium]